MIKGRHRIRFFMMLLFLMIFFASAALVNADGQDGEETVAPESPSFWGSVGSFFEDGYNRASEGLDSIVSSTGDFFGGQSDDEVIAPDGGAEPDAAQAKMEMTPLVSPSPEAEIMPVPTLPPNALKHYMGSTINAGKDTGYNENHKIDARDPHFGWTLGRFFVSGYTRVTEDANANPVFIKTLGDQVTLWFSLEQDINQLNGNDKLVIAEDKNGFDEYFGIPATDFGRGALIVRHTDYQNLPKEPTLYTNYLVAKAVISADTQVELFEEGDYEVALNYELKNSWHTFNDAFSIGNFSVETHTIDDYANYRIFFRFSVRNGNCMVYPFDVATKAELTNTAMTENGFYLDLARSRYLDINIKKEVLTRGATGLTEDTRFNRPAKDGDEYTEEGVYTITVANRYTGQQTTKQIYVGTDNILKAHMTTGLSIKEIDEQLAMGAQITDDGILIPAP